MKRSDPSSGIDRRALVLSAGRVALASGVRAETHEAATPSKAEYMKVWNAAEKVELWPNGAPGVDAFHRQPVPADADPAHIFNVERPALHVFRSPRPSGQGLLVIPGGAYRFVSIDNEGLDVADRLNPSGVTVFVLTYRLPGEGWARRRDVPLQDAQRAMRLIRSRTNAFGIDPERLAALGFSAGGHLAASLATDFAHRIYEPVDTADALNARPFAVGLVYPVILMQRPFTHLESRENLLGPSPSPETEAARSPVRHVGPDTPPLFLAHAMDDDAVPVDNSIRMMEAMRAASRPVETHLFQEGRHAFGIGRPGTPSALWPEQFRLWLERLSATRAA
jgi:acetyl esterase/lipase